MTHNVNIIIIIIIMSGQYEFVLVTIWPYGYYLFFNLKPGFNFFFIIFKILLI